MAPPRAQFAAALIALVLVAVILAVTGPGVARLYDVCKAAHTCGQVSLSKIDNGLETALQAVLLLAPALIGIFWGAPLVAHELETGTYRLSWSQSVSRDRWLAMKLGVVGLGSVAAAGLLSLMVTWWSNPIDTVDANRFGVAQFGLRDITPLGYAAFAFALGVTAGVVLRRTLPAMASTLVAYMAARLAFTTWVRPHLMSPLHADLPLHSANAVGFSITPTGIQVVANAPSIPNEWVYSSAIVNNTGQAPTASFLKTACPNLPTGPPAGGNGGSGVSGVSAVHVRAGAQGPGTAFQECVAKLATRYHEVVTYQPARRFWAFQGIETALYVALALLLAGLCLWWVRHRIA